MANICCTTVTFQGPPAAIQWLADLYGKANELATKEKGPFGGLWEGYLLLMAENADADTSDGYIPSVSCRGEVIDVDIHDTEITFFCDDAWGPNEELWQAVWELKREEGLIYALLAEEPGDDLFLNTDLDVFPEIALVDIEDRDTEYPTGKTDLDRILGEAGIVVAGCESSKDYQRVVDTFNNSLDVYATNWVNLHFFRNEGGEVWFDMVSEKEKEGEYV